MADYSNSTIPHSSIEEMCTDIRHTLGLPNTLQWNQPGWLCCSDRVNKWSRHKPIFFKLNGTSLTTEDDHGIVTGFCEMGTTFKHVPIVDYKIPAESRRDVPLRWTDFTSYKHKAPRMRVAGSNDIIGGGQSSSLTFQVWTPEIAISRLTNNCNAICILAEMSNGAGMEVVGFRYLSIAEMTSTSSAYYKISVPYTAWNPPSDTIITTYRWLAFGNGESEPGPGGVIQKPIPRYIVGNAGSDEVMATFKITITAKPDVTDPNQWKKYSYSEVDSIGITLGKEVLWDEFKTWTHRNDGMDLTKLYINNIRGAWGRGVRLEYYNGTNWVLLTSFTSTTAYYEKDILIESISMFRIIQLDFDQN